MKSKYLLAFTALASAGFAFGQASTNPVGYVTITCLPNSDTIVGVPLRQSAAYVGSLNGAPNTTNPVPAGFAVLTLSGTPGLSVDAFANTHYVKFTNTTPAATGDGQWFAVTANTADTLTVDLNGGSIAAVSGAGLEVIKFWTLAELFNPAVSTNSPLTTGNAIVTSASESLLARRTEVLIPNLNGVGTNLAPNVTFYISAGIWKQQGQGAANRGTYQFWPDSYFIIRHPASVTSSTSYTSTGEVEAGDFDYSLSTRAVGSQDNFVALQRPVDATLNSLNLGGTSAFMSSASTSLLARRDQLLVYNNAIAGRNKAPSFTYFYSGGKWKLQGDGVAEDRGLNTIPAGGGFIIRKYQSGTGLSSNWDNTPNY